MSPEEINQKHDQAMEYAGLAQLEKAQGNVEQARELFLKAYKLERPIAEFLASTEIEPSRSVIHRSAASLAIDCGKYREAEKLIAVALAGNPPNFVADELRELLLQIVPILREPLVES